MMRKIALFILCCFGLFLFSCKKDVKIEEKPDETKTQPASLVVNFSATANNKAIEPNDVWYKNSSDDGFTISLFNYYISNIKLTKQDGTIFAEPESYHLIQHINGSTSFTIANVPVGTYKSIEFLIGVDSLRNISGAQTGALDVANQMFWDWDTGYIFLKLEGEYYSVETPNSNFYAIHIGGFLGEHSCLQKASFDLAAPIVAKGGKSSTLKYKVSVDEIFDGPQKIGFDYYYGQVKFGPKIFRDISLNYIDIFQVESVTNP